MLYFSHKHAFLLSSAAMEGRKGLVLQTADELEDECDLGTVARVLGGSFLSYTAWRWMAMLRFGEFDAVLADTGAAESVDSKLLPYTAAMRHYVRGFALASSAKCDEAWEEARAFDVLASNATTRAQPLFLITAGQAFDVANSTMHARLAGCAPDRRATALRGVRRIGGAGGDSGTRRRSSSVVAHYWQQAVEMVDRFPYMEPPIWPSNLRACLGQALLDEGRYEDAQAVFEKDLEEWPGNGWSLKGLHLALKGQPQGKATEAWLARRKFEAAWRNADFELDRSCF